MSNDVARVILKEEYVLEKFDGDEGDPNRVLRERTVLVKEGDGELEKVSTEYFDEQGNPITLEGGNDGTNNRIP